MNDASVVSYVTGNVPFVIDVTSDPGIGRAASAALIVLTASSEIVTTSLSSRSMRSTAPKKNVLFRTMGPPKVPPKFCLSNCGLGSSAGTKALRASIDSSRKK